MKKNDVLYSGIVLDEKSRTALLAKFGYAMIDEWKVYAHHMTICLGELPERLKGDIGKEIELEATHFGTSDFAIAIKVNGYYTTNVIGHITLSINEKEGGKPVMSNQIKTWTLLSEPIKISGVVTEIKK